MCCLKELFFRGWWESSAVLLVVGGLFNMCLFVHRLGVLSNMSTIWSIKELTVHLFLFGDALGVFGDVVEHYDNMRTRQKKRTGIQLRFSGETDYSTEWGLWGH